MRLSAEDAFRRFGDRVFSAAFSVTGSREDADDVVQETFLKYCGQTQEFRDEEHLKAWLLRVAINRAKDLLRAFWRRNTVPWEEYMEELRFSEPEDRDLFEAVMGLPRKYRVTLHLYYYEEYSITEIADILHTTQGTVKSQLSRGRKLLKTKLTEAWDDDE